MTSQASAIRLFMAAVTLMGALRAQSADNLNSMQAATALRRDLFDAVGNGSEKPAAALARLKKEKSPTGLQLDADADFAFAAIDVGRRLIATRKATEAEAFFRAAETALDLVIGRTADSAARDKVQYLQARATIRANYLNKLTEGKADLAAALKLAQDNPRLKQLQRLLPADPAATLQKFKTRS